MTVCHPVSSPDIARENVRAKKLLADLHPSTAAYREYRGRADGFLALFARPLAESISPGQPLIGLRLRKSLLFRLEYLVAYADPVWFHGKFPTTDAIATEGVTFGSIVSPPLVLVPGTKRNVRDQVFRSILEHEFVHVNQVLLGTFPDNPTGRAKELLASLFHMTRVEYEANLLQLTRWPRLYRSAWEQHRMSMESWCVFRGYTQGLEQIVLAVKEGRVAKVEFLNFLDELPAVLPTAFRRMGFDGELGQHCAARVRQHASTAMEVLATQAHRSKPEGQ